MDAKFNQMLQSSYGNHNSTYMEPPDVLLESGAPLEDEVDWSICNCMLPEKDQRYCSACWAFSTGGTVEVAHWLTTGELLDLSE